MTLSRRNLLRNAGGLAALGMISPLRAQSSHRVVVVGGGFAGSTCARYLALWGGSRMDITLVDPSPAHSSCVMSNLVLTDTLSLDQLTFSHASLADRFGFRVVTAAATGFDPMDHTLSLDDGSTLAYDSLVLAPGIEFAPIEGYDASLVPHAWIAGPQTLLLRDQLQQDLPPGGRIVMTVPESPYRCPPGPYERACLLAAIARQVTDRAGGSSVHGSPKVIVLDGNSDIQAEKETFTAAFTRLYGDIIEYIPNAKLLSVDSVNRSVETSAGTFAGDVVNVIPNHRAPEWLRASGLTGTGDWAPVDPVSYESKLAGFTDVHVIGDAQTSGQPKSGHVANAQAKVCADAILRRSAGLATHSAERLANITTNSACFSPVSFREASWLTAVFRYNPGTGLMEAVPESFGASDGWNSENHEDMYDWASNLLSDTFV